VSKTGCISTQGSAQRDCLMMGLPSTSVHRPCPLCSPLRNLQKQRSSWRSLQPRCHPLVVANTDLIHQAVL